MASSVTLTIHSLGAQGDGIASMDDDLIYVDGALKGEIITATIDNKNRATVQDIISPSPHRVAPPCPHYHQCGGCVVQHMDIDAYRAWKYENVQSTLAQKNITPDQWDDPIFIPAGTRRRATFSGIKNGNTLTLGYTRKKSHDIFNLKSCDVLTPDIVDLQNTLSIALGPIIPHKGKISLFIQQCDNGMDVCLTGTIGAKDEPDLLALETIADIVNTTPIIRLSWRSNEKSALQTLIEKQKPKMQFGTLNVAIAPLAFLQPSTEGQTALMQGVMGFLPSSINHACDLFCGYGTFTGALLSTTKKIDAYEGDKTAINALKNAGLKTAWARDLFRDPLTTKELDIYDTVVIDPPRAGASAQAAELAKSNVKHIIAVSCNPASFARDAHALIEGGYRLERIKMVDQFIYSGHAELIAKFIRD